MRCNKNGCFRICIIKLNKWMTGVSLSSYPNIQIKGDSQIGSSVGPEEGILSQYKSRQGFKFFHQLAPLFSYFLFIGKHFVNLDAKWKACRFLANKLCEAFSKFLQAVRGLRSSVFTLCLSSSQTYLLQAFINCQELSSCEFQTSQVCGAVNMSSSDQQQRSCARVSCVWHPLLWPAGAPVNSRLLLNWGISVEDTQSGDFRQAEPGSHPASYGP